MQTIGERLEEARKRKGISIREAAETTKIRGDYLQKFEANSFEVDLPPLYVRGFLRSYARFLDLDPDRMVSDFDALGGRESKPRRETRENYGRVDFNEASAAPEAGGGASSGGRSEQEKAVMLKFALLGGGALVAVIIIIFLVKLLFSGSAPKATSNAQGPAQTTVQAEAAQTLTLTAIEATRVKIVQEFDGTILFNGSLVRSESKTLKKQGTLLITVEDRTKVRVEVNGKLIAIPVFPANQGNYGQFRLD